MSISISIRLEDQLLLLCVHRLSTPARTEQIRDLLKQRLDWGYILARAFEHKIGPMLYQVLSQQFADNVPTTFMAHLQHHSKSNLHHNLFLTREAQLILNLFEQHNIRAILFKGPVLSSLLYHNVTLRCFDDLDFLLQEQDIPKARGLLLQRGYETAPGQPTEDKLPESWYHYPLKHAKNGMAVELHWKIAPNYLYFPLTFTDLWTRSMLITVLDQPMRTFSLEDTLLVLCMHGSKHQWVNLNWICDIATLLDADLNWQVAMQRAETLHCLRMLLLGLHLAHTLLDAPLPLHLLEAIQADSMVARLGTMVEKWLFAPADDHVHFERSTFQIRVRDTFPDRLLYIWIKQPLTGADLPARLPRPHSDVLLFRALQTLRGLRLHLLQPLKRLLTRRN